jgi:hypothetical protein
MQNSTRTSALTDARVQAKNEAAIPRSRIADNPVEPSDTRSATSGVALSRTASGLSARAIACTGTAIR